MSDENDSHNTHLIAETMPEVATRQTGNVNWDLSPISSEKRLKLGAMRSTT